MSRIFLGSRDMRTPESAERAAHEEIVRWRSTEIHTALGQRFRASVHVVVRRPWWMPARLYDALMRTIVVEADAERVR